MINNLNSALCRLCNRSFAKRLMTSHLKACWNPRLADPGAKKAQRWFHLVIEGRYLPEYWLHMQISGDATFGQLDGVLRDLWLECCGHMSAFEFPRKRPARQRLAPNNMAAMLELMNAAREPEDVDSDDKLMAESLSRRLQKGVVFFHQYDFGTTTELALRVAGEYSHPALKGRIKILARNEPPEIPCSVCRKPASQLCAECEFGGNALCDRCVAKHKCDPEMLMPIINSPRTGECGYCGPSVEP